MEDNEKRFEQDIESWLISEHGGWEKLTFSNSHFDSTRGIDLDTLILYIKSTQEKMWDRYLKIIGPNPEDKFYRRFEQEVNQHGILYVLKNGIKDRGCKFKIIQFKPSSTLNDATIQDYKDNITNVTRQFAYSPNNHNTIDMVLSINGIPVVALELKNQFKGQSVDHAKKQFMFDRDEKELVFQFNHRFLVYFAVDLHEVWMTTKLAGSKTYFLPFNQGSNGAGNVGGAGNPDNNEDYITAYLWKTVLQKDALLEILQNFINLEIKTEKDKNGKQVERKTLIFPRYHQLDVVRKLIADTGEKGSGQHYLIQHSAGSGKSNSIAWLAYHLQKIHTTQNEPLFDSIIIVTDRTILDRQLQKTITSFDAKTGLVETIGDNKTSKNLLEAINDGRQIIITTLQKFPIIYQEVNSTKGKRFAVIVDEAHSSQTGTAAQKLKQALADKTEALKEWEEFDEEEAKLARDKEDQLNSILLSQGRHENISFYAFTATPKIKTMEMFGTRREDGKFLPFHVYSMRQAIEEGFILDVLKNYMTYHTAYKMVKNVEDNPEVIPSLAKRAIIRYAELHPYNLAQKTEVMIEAFRERTKSTIGGQGKAMVVTSSRLAAVRYLKEFKRYIEVKGYNDINVLVAFSGEVTDGTETYTETSLNVKDDGSRIKESQLKEVFHTPEYNILIVAEKYQTGFDEPLLHTMFVDKKLRGVKAVQTLSRLNRTTNQKTDTFILDFKNTSEEIKEAFQPFYEVSILDEAIDPNILYDAKARLRNYGVYNDFDVKKVIYIYEETNTEQDDKLLGRLAASFKSVIDRYNELDEETQYEFRTLLRSFKDKYNYIAQLMRMFDKELLEESIFITYLITLIPRPGVESVDIKDKVKMDYYKLKQDTFESINLISGEDSEYNQQQGINPVIKLPEDKDTLTSIIDTINSRFPDTFTASDKVVMEMVYNHFAKNPTSHQKSLARHNDYNMFRKSLFPKEFEDGVLDLSKSSGDLFTKLFSTPELFELVQNLVAEEIYKTWRNDELV